MKSQGKVARYILAITALAGAAFAGLSLITSLRHALGLDRAQTPRDDGLSEGERRLMRELDKRSVRLPLEEWGLKPLPADFDLDAYRAAGPTFDPPLSQTVIEMREDERY